MKNNPKYSFNGEIIETKKVAIVNVKFKNFHLYQKYLILSTGKIISRNFSGISETLEDNETGIEAAIRGLKEELNLVRNDRNLLYLGSSKELKVSPSSGKLCEYCFYIYETEISQQEKDNISLEIQENKGKVILSWKS